ncbi:breast cancer metastasis-suppressor 1-like protein isoform X2 [Dysidea avara]|uniref:breast cancer metastasis-suppressor 1-like protein isoform X2 n=1 Tax=Dysidea avara TaxID=196820 RepID=UPI00331BA88D
MPRKQEDNGSPSGEEEMKNDSVNSENDDSTFSHESEYDEEIDEKRKSCCVEDVTTLEKYFMELKNCLYHEKMTDIDRRLDAVKDSSSQEYLQQLQELEKVLDQREKLAEMKYRSKLEYIQACFDEELQTAEKQQEEEQRTIRQKIEQEIKEKISQSQEEMVANELSEGWGSTHRKRRRLEFSQPEKRKKPSSVSGPYIVYMLREIDILEDVKMIRKSWISKVTELQQQYEAENTIVVQGDKLLINNNPLTVGTRVVLKNTTTQDTHRVTIAGISSSKITVAREDDSKAAMSLSSLQTGLFTVTPTG